MRLRHAGGWCGFAILIGFAAFALDRLAHWRIDRHLDASAVRIVAAALHGQSPWRWDLRREDDVIAGRAFGPATTRFDTTGFHVVATADARIEVGLALKRAIDLAGFDRLDVRALTTDPLEMSFVLRETLASEECRSSIERLDDGDNRIDLGVLDWRCGGSAHAMPKRAEMFRLQFDLRRGQAFALRAASLHPTIAMPSDGASLGPPHRLPPGLEGDAVAAFAAAWPETQPLVELPVDARGERTLALRDALWRARPAAIPVTAGSANRVLAEAQALRWPPDEGSAFPARIIPVLWALLLLGARLRPPQGRRARAITEILSVIGGPFWFALVPGDPVVGGAMIIVSLVFAASIARFRDWQLAGSATSWILPGLSVLAALVLVALLGDGTPMAREEDLPGYLLRYLAWAAIQQWLICAIVMDRASSVFGAGRWSVSFASIAFALMHAPNPMLMQLTLAGGLVWTANWLRHRALLPNIVAHAACGILLANTLPIEWLRSAEVGMRYFF
jgi:hypothetical protein